MNPKFADEDMEAQGLVLAQITQGARAGRARIPPEPHGVPTATQPSCVASYLPSPGEDPPLTSLLWHHHLRLRSGECISFIHYTWVLLAVQ